MKNTITLFFLFSFSISFAQYAYPKPEYAKKVLSSTLVVELLDGEGEVVSYMNNSIKEVFSKNWKETELLFLTKTGIDSLCKIHKNGYAILFQDDFKYNEKRSAHIDQNGNFGFGVGSVSTSYTAFSFSYYSCYLKILNDGKYDLVTSIGFGNGNLTNIDYMFLCQEVSRLVNAAAAGKSQGEFYNVSSNLKQLEATILVLPKFFFKEKDYTEISKYYKYKYELVDAEAYQRVIMDEEAGKTYVKIIWSFHHSMYMWVVVNADDGAILSITGFGGVSFGKNQDANDIIKAKHFKYVTSKLAQKINNRYRSK